ncbi:hypothetical protein ACVW0Q_000138 [Thermostichus sp. MS-CIW-21]|jgi:hypothetical protein
MGKQLKWLAGFSAPHSSAGLPSYPFVWYESYEDEIEEFRKNFW